mmetsp:Transcript_102447/g.330515  ORF Transcript_102447/g.330515 Transcript_102447/m.330515 type:complete len:289 (-) Transcript_102447:1314-2180(-)
MARRDAASSAASRRCSSCLAKACTAEAPRSSASSLSSILFKEADKVESSHFVSSRASSSDAHALTRVVVLVDSARTSCTKVWAACRDLSTLCNIRSIRSTERSVTGRDSRSRFSMNSGSVTSGTFWPLSTSFSSRARSRNRCCKSSLLRPDTSQNSAEYWVCSKIFSNSGSVSSPSLLRSVARNRHRNRSWVAVDVSSSFLSSSSFWLASAALNMFSLTTAVRMERMPQDEMTMNVAQMTFVTGITSKSGCQPLGSPFMALNSTYMVWVTDEKAWVTDNGAATPKMRP